MNVAVAVYDAKQDAPAPASEAGPAPKRVVAGFGFWVFLLSDIVMFSALFAAYAVLVHANAGGPVGAQLFNQASVAIETADIKLYVRIDVARGRCTATSRYLFVCFDHFPARCRVPLYGGSRVFRHDRPRRNTAA